MRSAVAERIGAANARAARLEGELRACGARLEGGQGHAGTDMQAGHMLRAYMCFASVEVKSTFALFGVVDTHPSHAYACIGVSVHSRLHPAHCNAGLVVRIRPYSVHTSIEPSTTARMARPQEGKEHMPRSPIGRISRHLIFLRPCDGAAWAHGARVCARAYALANVRAGGRAQLFGVTRGGAPFDVLAEEELVAPQVARLRITHVRLAHVQHAAARVNVNVTCRAQNCLALVVARNHDILRLVPTVQASPCTPARPVQERSRPCAVVAVKKRVAVRWSVSAAPPAKERSEDRDPLKVMPHTLESRALAVDHPGRLAISSRFTRGTKRVARVAGIERRVHA